MKTKYFITIGAALMMLASCTVEKRHYMSGYHVDWKANTENRSESVKAAEKNESTVATNEASNVSSNASITIDESTNGEAILVLEKSQETTASFKKEAPQSKTVISEMETSVVTEVVGSTVEVKSNNEQGSSIERENEKSHQSNDALILEIILAIIIPPIGVLLHQGSWDKKCWISLILTILIWLPGVIYSLLVVFDKI